MCVCPRRGEVKTNVRITLTIRALVSRLEQDDIERCTPKYGRLRRESGTTHMALVRTQTLFLVARSAFSNRARSESSLERYICSDHWDMRRYARTSSLFSFSWPAAYSSRWGTSLLDAVDNI